GGAATMRLADVWRLTGQDGLANVGLISAPHGDLRSIRRKIESWPAVAAVQDAREFRQVVYKYLGIGYALLAIMLAFCGVLAVAVLFNTSTLAILERARELATLEALGVPFRQISGILLVESALLGALGLVLGIPLGIAGGNWLLGLYQSDLFTLPYTISLRALLAAIGGILVAALLAQWPGLLWLRRLPLADAVRERIG
ncbi:MAG: ABC transporter permease, partial [Cyanobacteria bacterium REEB65]|nr:ABC transporter permease [Cyanobacteria bacterium REEB65]